MSRIFILLSLLLGSGCAPLFNRTRATCLAHGGRAWWEVTSPHFHMRTDLAKEDARKQIGEFEKTFSMFQDLNDFAFPGREPPRDAVELVVFASENEYREFGPPNTDGVFLPDADGSGTIVMPGEATSDTRRVFQHELTHRFVAHNVHETPLWLNEGLATYFSTVRVEGNSVIIGEPPHNIEVITSAFHQSRATSLGELPSVKQLLSADRRTFYAGEDTNGLKAAGNYAGAWELVYLLNRDAHEYAERFRDYVGRLVRGEKAPAAFEVSFAGVAPDRLEHDYRECLARSLMTVWTAPLLPHDVPTAQLVPMSEAQAHLVRIELMGLGTARRGDVLVDLNLALDHAHRESDGAADLAEIQYWSARVYRASNNLGAALREVEHAVELEPEETKYKIELATLQFQLETMKPRGEQTFEKIDALIKSLYRAARKPSELNLIARYHALRGQLDLGMPFAHRAVEADPGCWQCVDTLALLHFRKGRAILAADLQARAVGLIPDGLRVPEAAARLKTYRSAAAAQSGD